eukprot:Hpha_TRINITY_DN11483_c0_g1::TRINITY_DN11483_c0_g1_i2::g.137358::m.137358/K16535/FOPNL, FOR20; lisH domain-containing protein FOPNL
MAHEDGVPAADVEASSEGTDAVKENLRRVLEAQGVLGPVKATLRAAIFRALEGQAPSAKPDAAHETMLINELIREYLEFNGYRNTAATLCLEAGSPQQPFERGVLARQVGAEYATGSGVPLLYSLVGSNKN